MKIALRILATLGIAAMTVWAVGALYYSPLLPEAWRPLAAASYAGLTVVCLLFLRRHGRTAIVAVIAFAVLVGLFFQIPRRITAIGSRKWRMRPMRRSMAI
jgi:hypothetical protein